MNYHHDILGLKRKRSRITTSIIFCWRMRIVYSMQFFFHFFSSTHLVCDQLSYALTLFICLHSHKRTRELKRCVFNRHTKPFKWDTSVKYVENDNVSLKMHIQHWIGTFIMNLINANEWKTLESRITFYSRCAQFDSLSFYICLAWSYHVNLLTVLHPLAARIFPFLMIFFFLCHRSFVLKIAVKIFCRTQTIVTCMNMCDWEFLN